MNDTIETINNHGIGVLGDRGITMLIPPLPGQILEQEDALRMAAWIVALADEGGRFDEIRAAIMRT